MQDYRRWVKWKTDLGGRFTADAWVDCMQMRFVRGLIITSFDNSSTLRQPGEFEICARCFRGWLFEVCVIKRLLIPKSSILRIVSLWRVRDLCEIRSRYFRGCSNQPVVVRSFCEILNTMLHYYARRPRYLDSCVRFGCSLRELFDIFLRNSLCNFWD